MPRSTSWRIDVAEHAVEARDLIRTFDDGTGIRGVDICVAPGEIHALVGLNGAGKSTLMRLLLGMLEPASGTVTIAGQGLDRTDWSQVGHLVEYPLAYRELTCRQNLALGARLHGVPPIEITRLVEAAIVELHLTQYADRRTGKLSLGNRQRLGLASALQHDPLIVLDEPTNTLDPAGVILLREALLRRAAAGAGILVSSHHLDEVARIADRISVLNAGRIIGTLDPHGVDIERSFFDLVHSDDVAA
jgi:ABC-2 type transport system ATP-binding protein